MPLQNLLSPTWIRQRLPQPNTSRFRLCLDLSAIPDSGFVVNRSASWWLAACVRSVDVTASLILLAVMLPILVALAVLIQLDSPGPAIYKQERLGLNGVTFSLLKFRSMRLNAEAGGPVWASVRDPRMTRVGSFMRLTRLDELPQIWNVLRGEMALIGPRPERALFTETLATAIPHFRARTQVKPGLTGWAQVNRPYSCSDEDARTKLAYDLYYVQHRSVVLNLRIAAATLRMMLIMGGR